MQLTDTKLAIMVAAALAGGGCSLLDRDRPGTPVLGERISVLTNEVDVMEDPATAAMPMTLPAPVANSEWAQSGGNASKSLGHLALGGALQRVWTTSIGRGTSVIARLGAAPVVGGGRIYTIDTYAVVRAFDVRNGGQVWEAAFGREKGNEASLFGGGVAFDNGRIYATNGLGYVAAFDAATGRIAWQVRPGGPLRGSPTVAGDAVYVMSQDNQIYSLKTANGASNWSQAASLEIAGVFGTGSPAFAQGTVIAGFSSGELNAYRYENGRPVWQDALARTSIRTSVSTLSDIDADPVVDRGQVIAIGQGGRMVALELISGQRLWELNVAGISTPWVAGDWVFAVTDDAKVIAVSRATGKIRWISQLQAFRNEKRRSGPIGYAGPVLAGNRLILTRTPGQLIFLDARTGRQMGGTTIGAATSLPPVVANSTLYVLDDAGRLHAFR
jgi:outer membrane protein assembly factor BamB